MRKDIKKLVRECHVCQVNKYGNVMPPRLLQPLPIPHIPWLDISIDFIKDHLVFDGMTIILTVVDRFIKFSHLFALSHPYIISKVARVFFDGVFKLYGLPKSIVSD